MKIDRRGHLTLSENDRLLISLFLPIYAIHCMEQIYFIYGTVVQGYGVSPEMTGWVLSAFFIAIMLARPMGSWLLENFGIRPTLAVASILGLVGCVLLFFARGVTALIVGRVLSGASFGMYSIGMFAYQALIIPEAMRGAVFAIVVSGGVLPMATVTPIGEWLLMRGNLRAYLAMGPLLCVACWYLGRRVGTTATVSSEEKKHWGSYSELLGNKQFAVLACTGCTIALIDATTVNMSLLATEYGLVTSYFLVSSSIAGVFVRIACNKILNALPRFLTIAPSGIFMAGSLLCISLFPSNRTLLIAGTFFGIGIGAAFPTYLSLVSDTLSSALRPKGTATALFIYDCGWFITPLIVGYTSSLLGIAWTFRIISLVTLTMLISALVFYWAPNYFSKKRL